MEIEELKSTMADWPVQWRWEGTSGHPRRMADIFVQTFEEQGFTVEVADAPLSQGPLGNVAEFEGALIARASQSRKGAAKKKWAAGIVGIALLPLVVGYFVLKYAFEARKYEVGLEWRGEAYSSTARADQGGFGAERAGIVSDVRVTLRGAVFELGKLINDVSDIQPKLTVLEGTFSETLPALSMPTGVRPSQPALGSEQTMPELGQGAEVDVLPPEIEEPPQPPMLGDGR